MFPLILIRTIYKAPDIIIITSNLGESVSPEYLSWSAGEAVNISTYLECNSMKILHILLEFSPHHVVSEDLQSQKRMQQ